MVVEDSATDAPDHRAMPSNQCSERRIVPAADVILKQLSVGHCPAMREQHASAKPLKDVACLSRRHLDPFVLELKAGKPILYPYTYPLAANWYTIFRICRIAQENACFQADSVFGFELNNSVRSLFH